MKVVRVAKLMVMLLSVLVLAACGGGGGGNGNAPPTLGQQTQAEQSVTQAKAELENGSISKASQAFEDALEADPNNKDANFGGAVTKVVMLIEDDEVKDVLKKWDIIAPSVDDIVSGTSPVNPFGNWKAVANKLPTVATKASTEQNLTQAALSAFDKLVAVLPKDASKNTVAVKASSVPEDATTVGEVQNLISGTLIPELETVLKRLQKVEGTGFKFVVTKAMQGNPTHGKDITLGDGEIYALKTAVNAVLCALNFAVSYNLDLYDYNGNGKLNDYDKLGKDPLKTINQLSFFTLKSKGSNSMNAAFTALKGAVSDIEKAYNVVKGRTAAQTAAGQGAFDLTNLDPQDKADFEKYLGYAKDAIKGKTTIKYNKDTEKIDVDLPKLFTNPLTRANLPVLKYDGNNKIVVDSDLPDCTLNGLFPDNGSDCFNSILK